MKLDSLKPLLDHDGPLTTVCLDVTRADEAGDREIRSRWNGLRRSLEQAGAPPSTLELMAAAVLRPTHVPGPHGRFVVAAGEQILFDRVLAEAPAREEAFHDGVPALMPAAQAAGEAVRYLLVEVDRSGADLSWSGTEVPDTSTEHVEGGHDVLHKAHAGGWSGWSSRRMQARVEDSWERNAEAVAAELNRAVIEHRPELVMITGDLRAVALIREEVSRPTAELIVEVPGGSRAEGIKEEVFAGHVHAALEDFRAQRREKVVDRLREGLGRGGGGVTGLGDVVEVLRRGQVAELIIEQDAAGVPVALHQRRLWVGPGPLEIAVRRSELTSLGVDVASAQERRADIALLRAAVAQDAGVTFALEGGVELVDGLGAVLRWTDAATPHEVSPSYTADSNRRRGHS
ncbi:Vms1/Ankzf1 family peptidyl-tRNA hydrolase [Cellulomonas sp. KRMCY2]|uniref:baeRF2 domain-containing protein n=1 Tax=Cellulomonas sp. KRMCY2 TaxID=1304865 RepID=UPI00045EB4A1|nr:Vms1/Ankzf1 family peptidyl-tRNA hydrolase [Cellulomonas sp. KRMCY2]